MDIDLLSKMVKELILDNDKVVLPGLGAFVAEIVPSSFSDKGYTINPPYRRLSFRTKPDAGDELAEFYAASNNVEKDVAARIISDFIDEMRLILHKKKTVLFPGLGRLRATKENNLFFVADEDLDIYPAGFGLEPISLKTHQETTEEVSAAVESLKSMLDAEPVTELIPEAMPEPVAEPAPDPSIEQVPEPVPEPDPVTETEIQPQPVAEPIPDPEVGPKEETAEPREEESKKHKGKGLIWAALGLAVFAALLLAAFAIVGRLCPEWVDSFLYTPEELEILNHRL